MISGPLNEVDLHSVQLEQPPGWLCFVGIQFRVDSKEGKLVIKCGHWGQRRETTVWGMAFTGHLGDMEEA